MTVHDVPKPGSEARFLRKFPTFKDLPDRDVRKIVAAADRVTLPANWPLIHEQTPGDACYILLAGRVAVYAGRERIADLGAGDVVGETALRQGALRSATVSTVDAVDMLRIEGADLSALLRAVPRLRAVLDASIAAHGGAAGGNSH